MTVYSVYEPSAEAPHLMQRADRLAFDATSLTAPAGKTWHVKIDNQETFLKHNFTVASGKTVAERIFQSPNFGFGTSAFDVPALPAGTYLFVCTIHPETMTGTLTIR